MNLGGAGPSADLTWVTFLFLTGISETPYLSPPDAHGGCALPQWLRNRWELTPQPPSALCFAAELLRPTAHGSGKHLRAPHWIRLIPSCCAVRVPWDPRAPSLCPDACKHGPSPPGTFRPVLEWRPRSDSGPQGPGRVAEIPSGLCLG